MPEYSNPSGPERRGAPKGNANALKHGFYSRQFKKRDVSDLEKSEFKGLSEEINLMRVIIRQAVEMGKNIQDIYTSMDLMRVICLATSNLARLVRIQQVLVNPADEFEAVMDQVLEEVIKAQQEAPDILIHGFTSSLNPDLGKQGYDEKPEAG